MKKFTAVVLLTSLMVMWLASSVVPYAAVEKRPAVLYEEHIVKDGDALTIIAKRYGADLREIVKVNKIKRPDVLYIGKKLLIPIPCEVNMASAGHRQYWRRVGANPYTGTKEQAINVFDLPLEIKWQVEKMIAQGKFELIKDFIRNGTKLEEVVFGDNQIMRDVLCQWTQGESYPAKVYRMGAFQVIQVLKCNNFAWQRVPLLLNYQEVEDIKTVKNVEVSVKKDSLFPPPPVHPGIGRISGRQQTSLEKFDAYIGGGYFENFREQHGTGWYVWGKTRYRPFLWQINEKLDMGMGLFAFAATGSGKEERFNWRFSKYAFGPSVKLRGLHWDADFDFGPGQLYTEGKEGEYKSWQRDTIAVVSAHLNSYKRRDEGKKWLPANELNFEATIPLASNKKSSFNGEPLSEDPFDNKTVEVSFRQGIRDIALSKQDKSLFLTPHINLGGSYEWGRKEAAAQVGPGAKVTWHNKDIASIDVVNPKFDVIGGGGYQMSWISGYVNIGGVYQAIRAHKIKEATAADLQFTKGQTKPKSEYREYSFKQYKSRDSSGI